MLGCIGVVGIEFLVVIVMYGGVCGGVGMVGDVDLVWYVVDEL